MNRLLISVAAAALLSAPAMAQVSDITGRVTGTVDQTTRLGVEALDNEAVIDQRTGLQLDSRLHGQLERALPRHDGGAADASLQSQLDADANAFARVNGRSAGASLSSRGGMRAGAGGQFAPVNVYASDGALVGRVDRLRRSGGRQHVVIRGSDRDRIEIPVEQAAFDASANAVVLAMTSAEMTGGAASAAVDGAADAALGATGAVDGAAQAAAQAGAGAPRGGCAHGGGRPPAPPPARAGGRRGAPPAAAAAGAAGAARGGRGGGGGRGAGRARPPPPPPGAAGGGWPPPPRPPGAGGPPGSVTGALGLNAGTAANGAVPVFSADGALMGHADGVFEVDGEDRLHFIGASSGQIETAAASEAAFNEQANAVVLAGVRADYDASAGLQQ
jgi:hypothetical protein